MRSVQSVRSHAEWIGVIDDDLAQEIAEALHRGFSRLPRCRKDHSLRISGRLLRREKPLARQRIVFGIGGIGHADNQSSPARSHPRPSAEPTLPAPIIATHQPATASPLSGCRKSEILSLRWEWVDIERGVLRLPDSKTGAKVVPLAAAAEKLLAELPRCADYVLPGATGTGHYIGLQKDWERVRSCAGLAGVRVHDLRHSFASFAVADGNSLYLIGKVLGHKQARTTEIYAHLADDPIRAVADRTAARIAAAMSRTDQSDPTKVVPMRGSRS